MGADIAAGRLPHRPLSSGLMHLLIHKGGAGFEKVHRCQKAGAIGCVIVNQDDTVLEPAGGVHNRTSSAPFPSVLRLK